MKKNLFWALGLLILVVVVFVVVNSSSRIASNNQDMGAAVALPSDNTGTTYPTSLLGQGSVCTAHNQCGGGYCQMALEYTRSGFWPFYSYKQVNRCNDSINSCIVNSSMSVTQNTSVRVSTINAGSSELYKTTYSKAVSYNPTGYYKVLCGISPDINYGWAPVNSQLKPIQGHPWFDITGIKKY